MVLAPYWSQSARVAPRSGFILHDEVLIVGMREHDAVDPKSLFITSLVAVFFVGTADELAGYPGPVFETAAPVLGPEVEKTEVPSGTYSVSTRTGAARYSYPMTVPPGRRGMEPGLVLSYSSRNPVRGGVAAGWQLDIPSIRIDTSSGRVAETHYLSTLAGGQRLIPVDEPARRFAVETFRAEQDASYTRYEKVQIVPAGVFFWHVTFRYKDYRRNGQERYRTMTLVPGEFIRRFLLHVLPKGFHRIRHYGLLASAARKANIARASELLAAPEPPMEREQTTRAAAAPTDHRPPCPCCGGRMIVVETFERGGGARDPPSSEPGIRTAAA
jgi:hypothetical protein